MLETALVRVTLHQNHVTMKKANQNAVGHRKRTWVCNLEVGLFPGRWETWVPAPKNGLFYEKYPTTPYCRSLGADLSSILQDVESRIN